MKKPIIYLLASLLFFLFVSFLLFRYSEKPSFYVAGTVGGDSASMRQELSSYSYVFFSVHKEGDKTPFATAKMNLNHDFTRGSYPFLLDDRSLFRLPMYAGEHFPESFTLRVRFSKSSAIAIPKNPGDSEGLRKVLGPIQKGEGGLIVSF